MKTNLIFRIMDSVFGESEVNSFDAGPWASL